MRKKFEFFTSSALFFYLFSLFYACLRALCFFTASFNLYSILSARTEIPYYLTAGNFTSGISRWLGPKIIGRIMNYHGFTDDLIYRKSVSQARAESIAVRPE